MYLYIGSFKLKVQKEDSGFLEKKNKIFHREMTMDSATGRLALAIYILVCVCREREREREK
jgi:hypothetical protein